MAHSMRVSVACVCSLASIQLASCRASETPRPSETDAPFQTKDTGESKFACRYVNPFSGMPECKAYVGNGWAHSLAASDCADVFSGVDLSGELGEGPCSTQAAIGACITNGGDPQEAHTVFYDGPPAVAQSACHTFAGGEWIPIANAPDDAQPQGELMPEALDALRSDDQVHVTPRCDDYACVEQMAQQRRFFWFEPRLTAPTAGLILYPGGLVDPRAYAPQARAIALAGYLVVIVPMPGLLAINGVDRASHVMAAAPQIKHWLIGGHSLGGTVAGQFAFETGGVAGLLIWASYLSSDNNLSHTSLPSLTVYGSEEGLATDPLFETAKAYLPFDARYVVIDGGTHSQFGFYGNPKAETPLIDHATQLERIVAATVPFMGDAVLWAERRETRFSLAAAQDESQCESAQRSLTGMDESLLPANQLATVWHASGSDFASAKATIDATMHPHMTVHGYRIPHPLAGRWAPASLSLEVLCKMHSQDRIEADLGLTLVSAEGSCGDMNEKALAWAADQLDEGERKRYADNGVQLQVGEDAVASVEGQWLPQQPLLSASAEGRVCTIQAPALEIPYPDGAGEPQDLLGVHHCRFLSHSEALYWMTVQAYQSDACALPE